MRPILADAVDLARRALLELEPSAVGAHLGVIAEDESAATHRFEATLPGYRGWQWAVVVAAPPGADHATVSESALLPGPDALVAPEFVPWEQRVRPGDLAPGDLLAPPADDPRLVPGYVATGDPVVDEVAFEVGLGRTKVMSREGREEAAERWYTEHGPDSEMAKAAPATCGSCGFYLPLAGSLSAAFGVCGNAMGADGRVVHVAYGCGAHSDTEVPTGNGSPLYEAYDDAAIDVISLETDEPRRAARDANEARATEKDDRPGAADAVRQDAAQDESAAVLDRAAGAEAPAVSAGAAGNEHATAAEARATVEDSSAAAQPGGSTAVTDMDMTEAVVISAAEVGEIDAAAAFTEASVPPAVRAMSSADDIADAVSTATAADEPSVARGDADARTVEAEEVAGSDAAGSEPVDAPSADVAADTAVESDLDAAAESESNASSSAFRPAEPTAASSATAASVDEASGAVAPVSGAGVESATSGSTEVGTTGSSSPEPSSSATASDTPSSASESGEATDSSGDASEPAEHTEGADARSGSGTADGPDSEARPEFQSSPRS